MPDVVVLTGLLVCADDDQAALVRTYLPEHVSLTRAEPGCVSFEVRPTADPLVWAVSERFDGEAAFAAHQRRVAGSRWGEATAAIERRYTIQPGG